MNIFKNWKFLIIISIIVATAMLYGVLYTDATALPSENWSKGVTVNSFETSDNYRDYYLNYYDVITLDDAFIVSEFLEDKFIITAYDVNFNTLSQMSYDFSTILDGIVEKSDLYTSDDLLHVQYFLNNTLYQFDLNSDFTMNKDPYLIDDQIDSIEIKDGLALYTKAEDYYLKSESQTMLLFNRDDVELFDFDYNKESNDLYLALMTFSESKYRATTIVYDLDNNTYQTNELDVLKQPSATIPLDVNAFYDDNVLYTLFSMKNTKYGQNLNSVFLIDENSGKIIRNSFFNNYSYTPRFEFNRFGEKVVLMFNDLSFIGKTDVGSQNKTYTNLLISANFDDVFIPLTNTQNFAANSVLVTLNNYQYVFTNEVANGINSLFVNSDDPNIIEKSSHFSWSYYLEIFINTLTYVPASILALFSPLILLLFPVVIIILPIAIFKMTWAEKNQKKMLSISIVAYLISKLYFLLNNQAFLTYSNLGIGAEPWHLSSLPLLLLINIFTAFISYFSMKYYIYKHKDSYFILQFGFFFAMDLIQFLFYVQVYSVMFIN